MSEKDRQMEKYISDEVVIAACRAHTPQFDRLDEDIAKYAKDQMREAITAALNVMGETQTVNPDNMNGFSSEELSHIDPVNPDFFEAISMLNTEGMAIQALRKIEAAAIGGYLTPNLCAEIVSSALEDMENMDEVFKGAPASGRKNRAHVGPSAGSV